MGPVLPRFQPLAVLAPAEDILNSAFLSMATALVQIMPSHLALTLLLLPLLLSPSCSPRSQLTNYKRVLPSYRSEPSQDVSLV